MASALAGMTSVAVHMAAQAPAPPPQGPPPAQAPAGGGRGQGRGGQAQPGVFPAQQRPPGNPEVIARGKGLYTINCSGCHGADLRGGATGGPNLLRSQLVLSDQAGELILPIVRGARAEKGMPPLPLADDDVKAVAEYIHSVLATSQRQGAPPPTEAPPPDPLVGNAAAGETYFKAKCASCHSPTADLKGVGSRFSDARVLQALWITGGGGGGRGRGASRSRVTVTVTMPTGEKLQGPLVRIDDFIVQFAQEDGSIRSVRRDGPSPKVEINDPLAPHKALLSQLKDSDMHDVTAYLATIK